MRKGQKKTNISEVSTEFFLFRKTFDPSAHFFVLDMEEIKKRCAAHGIYMSELAATCGLAIGHLSHIDKGKIRCPNIDTAMKLSMALGCDIKEIIKNEKA